MWPPQTDTQTEPHTDINYQIHPGIHDRGLSSSGGTGRGQDEAGGDLPYSPQNAVPLWGEENEDGPQMAAGPLFHGDGRVMIVVIGQSY